MWGAGGRSRSIVGGSVVMLVVFHILSDGGGEGGLVFVVVDVYVNVSYTCLILYCQSVDRNLIDCFCIN